MDRWIRCRDGLPENGKKVFYFGILGLWRGEYRYSESEFPGVSPHVFYGGGGCCDTDEVTHWCPDDRDDGFVPLPPDYLRMVELIRMGAELGSGCTDEASVADDALGLRQQCESVLNGHREFI